MTKVSDLKNARDAAGVRYQKALAEFRESYIALASMDAALANVNVAGELSQSFGNAPDLWSLAHPKFAPHGPENWTDEIHARRDRLIADATRAL